MFVPLRAVPKFCLSGSGNNARMEAKPIAVHTKAGLRVVWKANKECAEGNLYGDVRMRFSRGT